MFKEINIPVILGFSTPEQAEICFNALEIVIPKLKMRDLTEYADESGMNMYMFYTRKDQSYRDMMEAYTSNTPRHEIVKFVGNMTAAPAQNETWEEANEETPNVGNWQNTGNI